MGAIWRHAVCTLIVLLYLVEEKMLVRIWLLAQAYIRIYQRKKNKPWQMLSISQGSAYIQFLYDVWDNLNLESWRLLTYFLRFKDYMKEDSKEIHVASTKQLNIKLEKERGKKEFLFSSCYIFEKLTNTKWKSFLQYFTLCRPIKYISIVRKGEKERKDRRKGGWKEGKKEEILLSEIISPF